MAKIEWGEPVEHPERRGWVETHGRIGDLRVATVRPDTSRKGGRWWVRVYLEPLPYNLDAMTYESKVSERAARATAQRVVNSFTRILTGEG
jgi:hypothetical protein